MDCLVAFIALPAGSYWEKNKDLLALGVSLLALIISIVTARQNVNTTKELSEDAASHAELMARSATYQRLHELLIDPIAASGRRRLFQAAQENRFPKLGEEGWDEINYSLALYDTLAGYVHRGHVDRELVLDAWHHPLANIAEPVRAFMAFRTDHGIDQPWAYLMRLLGDAEQFSCNCPPPTRR
ncbi:hypothetical protein [Streptomyces sp. SID13031]|uniref:hypothetical protein n=1 Tax=Streptomyces sp. SID13031 TaxID=2706046 RepID=UPI0013CD9BC0|nr:hypothetical protein [Streptomyces sp. SID13031]NEA31752.1 hypothetical protein [Streptomyces sp. SID13031]